MKSLLSGRKARGAVLAVAIITLALAWPAAAQGGNEEYTFQIYYVNSDFYPIVQAYLRTFDAKRDPLDNVTIANIGIMVEGFNYDPKAAIPSHQYAIETLGNRPQEGYRMVFVWDCSGSMAGQPFNDAKAAITKFIQLKRPVDQVAILAIRDRKEGYQLVSGFTSDPTALYVAMDDVKPDGQETHLYDSIAAAYELCTVAIKGVSSGSGSEFAFVPCIVVVSDGKDEKSVLARSELINKLTSLKTPVPVYSLAYSKEDTSHFANLENISNRTFGRYWTVSETQEFASRVQDIRSIVLKDYVVTFRSYVPIDGKEHSFAIALAYGTNPSSGLPRENVFKAIDSPAKRFPQFKPTYDKLNQAFPLLPAPGPYFADGCPPWIQNLAKTEPPPPPIDPNKDKVVPPPPPPPPVPVPPNPNDIWRLVAVGLGILILIVGIAVWVRKNASANRGSSSRSDKTSGGTKDL